jgi:hypothetical protein
MLMEWLQREIGGFVQLLSRQILLGASEHTAVILVQLRTAATTTTSTIEAAEERGGERGSGGNVNGAWDDSESDTASIMSSMNISVDTRDHYRGTGGGGAGSGGAESSRDAGTNGRTLPVAKSVALGAGPLSYLSNSLDNVYFESLRVDELGIPCSSSLSWLLEVLHFYTSNTPYTVSITNNTWYFHCLVDLIIAFTSIYCRSF